MTTDKKKDLIVQLVEDMSGCKVMELVVKYTVAVINAKIREDEENVDLGCILTSEPLPDEDEFNDEDVGNELVRLIEELVKEERVIEIDYVLPIVYSGLKSFLLPVGTQIKLGSNWAKNLYAVDEYREVIRMVRG